ncbi:beta-defensin 134 [Echinops telfairi]|uniref:Beta-defensin 134 n=1 Tax=Echinops telfairi TaxID=9371 RepID=A0ABM1VIQ3_ECHTE|nr:beta-defensin 134 [Echinops telfairi]
MNILLLVFAFLFLWDPVLAEMKPFSSTLNRKCNENGICRFECFTAEMLVSYCEFQLECCVRGNPGP